MAEKLKYFCNGQYVESKTEVYYDLHNPSTGEVTGFAPCCTADEVNEAIAAAKANDKVAQALEGKKIIKEIYVPGRIVNIVAK